MQLSFPDMPHQITKAEARILDYISNHTETFLFSSIGQLAKQLDVSDATVSRFARHVGCKDYKELKQYVIQQSTFEGPAAKMAHTLSVEEGFHVKNWIYKQQQYLQKTLEGLDDQDFNDAVEAVLKAKRVFIHAKSASSSLGQLLLFRLRRVGISVSLLPSGGSEIYEGLVQVQPNDLIIMFSFSKVSKEGQMILDYQKEVGYQTIAFCSRTFIPEKERADINLFVYRGELKEYHSMAAPSAMIDALVVSLSEKMGAQSANCLSKLHILKKKYSSNG
jgi:DNA-binding MurR/RpiR family transcriptional regulator